MSIRRRREEVLCAFGSIVIRKIDYVRWSDLLLDAAYERRIIMKNQGFKVGVVVGISLLLVAGCTTAQKRQVKEHKLTISQVKSKNWRKYLGKSITLQGYFVDRPAPMLVSSMDLLNINTPIPEKEYIRLTGRGIEGLKPEKFYGAYVALDGVVSVSKDKERKIMVRKFGDVSALEFICPDFPPSILEKPKREYVIPRIVKFCKECPQCCPKPEFILKNKYALLISGGFNSSNAHYRYWNDLTFMYNTLKSEYGFSDDNIVVVYKDGNGENNDITVDYAADSSGIDDAFHYLADKMTKNDTFLLFVTNHGGGLRMDAYYEDGQHTISDMVFGGRADTSGDETDEAIFEKHLFTDLNSDGDENDHVRYDEVIYLYNSVNDLWDDDLATYLDTLTYSKMVIILEQCFSGGFLADLRGKNRVIVSASSEYESSWMGPDINYDEFSYYFTSALAGHKHDGTAVDADTDNDGKVSILEAFEYARDNDTKAETPFYEDSGDGRGHTESFPQDGDGELGASLSLD